MDELILVFFYSVFGYSMCAVLSNSPMWHGFKKNENRNLRRGILIITFFFWPVTLGFFIYKIFHNFVVSVYHDAKKEWDS